MGEFMKNFSVKLLGKIWWWGDEYAETKITDAIYRKTEDEYAELVIDFTYEDCPYTTTLNSTDGMNFMGKFSVHDGIKKSYGEAECTLYENPEGYFLYGDKWREETLDLKWFAKLEKNEQSND